MKAKQFERQFDAGEDVLKALDLPKARRLRQQPKRVNEVRRIAPTKTT